MASRPILSPYPVIGKALDIDSGISGDMSQTTITSKVTIVQNLSQISYDISWTGSSPVGAISVQVSNTYMQNVDGTVRYAGDWNTLPLSATTNITGNTGNGFIDIDANAGYAVRLVYTKVSGTGTLSVVVSGKVA